MHYPAAVNLPFNFSSISDIFQLSRSPLSQPTNEPGFWCIIHKYGILMATGKEGIKLPEGKLPEWLEPALPPLIIGRFRGKPLRAFAISFDTIPESSFTLEPFGNIEKRMDISTMTLGGIAKQILHWDQNSHHCSICGATMLVTPNTWGKKCSSCSAEHFPHIHPCSIVLVKRENELLLARKAEWPAGRYSLVAGFLDFGESLEECAAREVLEETGIKIKNIRYAASQNWPFPSQLMAGFVADYADGHIVVDHNELEDARWCPADALPDLPPSRSIARWIIDNHARANR